MSTQIYSPHHQHTPLRQWDSLYAVQLVLGVGESSRDQLHLQFYILLIANIFPLVTPHVSPAVDPCCLWRHPSQGWVTFVSGKHTWVVNTVLKEIKHAQKSLDTLTLLFLWSINSIIYFVIKPTCIMNNVLFSQCLSVGTQTMIHQSRSTVRGHSSLCLSETDLVVWRWLSVWCHASVHATTSALGYLFPLYTSCLEVRANVCVCVMGVTSNSNDIQNNHH